METVANCVIPYVHQRDRNSVSLVCSRWYEIDRMTRKHITVHLHYAPTPLRLSRRFPFLESLTLKGYPSEMELLHKSHVNITPWIQEISASFKFLKSLHIRNVAIHDSDLELLARTRGKDLKVLKIVDCKGISQNGLMQISKGCNELRTLYLDLYDLDGEEGCVKWLQELALRNAGIETFYYDYFCDRVEVKDVALLVKNCSKSLVSLHVYTSYIDDLADALIRQAVKLEHFSGALYREDMEYSSFKFPSTIHSLGIYDFPKTSLPFVYPLLNQLRELHFRYDDAVKAACQCFFIQRCPNLEVLYTEDVCGDKGLQVISQFCKKLRKFTLDGCLGTHVGLIALALGCRNLEYLSIGLEDISNEALECLGTNLKNLRALYLRVRKDKDDIGTNLLIDDGIRDMLIGCTKLERLSIDLDGKFLTYVGLGFIGKYGINLRFLSLPYREGSVDGLKALSMGCPRLRKLELTGCNVSYQYIFSVWFNIPSLRYIWVLNKNNKVVMALTSPKFGSTMKTQGSYATLDEKLDSFRNLEVFHTKDVCGDKGLQVISQFCKKLRKFTLDGCLGTHVGLIALALGCRNLEDLSVELEDISNEALECIGTNLRNLRALYLRVRKNKDDIGTNLLIDDVIRDMLIGCTKLERLRINLDGKFLTYVGLGFIGKYGINLRFLSLPCREGSVDGLKALSMGCPRLRKLELTGCNVSYQYIFSVWFNIPSLRYIWVLNKYNNVVMALTSPKFGSSTMKTQGPYATLAEKLDRLAV